MIRPQKTGTNLIPNSHLPDFLFLKLKVFLNIFDSEIVKIFEYSTGILIICKQTNKSSWLHQKNYIINTQSKLISS